MKSDLAVTLRHLRLTRRLSMAGMERLTGIERTHISRMERDERAPSVETLHRIVTWMELSDEELTRLGRALLVPPATEAHTVRYRARG